MTSAAVMQPYLFPYLGYYQLANSVDEFVFFDDVNFIKRGFINRNSMLRQSEAMRFTLPVQKASQNRLIKDHYFTEDSSGVLSQLREAYAEAPQFSAVFPVVQSVLNDADRSVVNITTNSVESIFEYLGLSKRFSLSSGIAKSDTSRGQDKIIEICVAKDASVYVNAIGGKDLYDPEAFSSRGIELKFIRMLDKPYAQPVRPFVPNLSIIDALMNCTKAEVVELLRAYELEGAT